MFAIKGPVCSVVFSLLAGVSTVNAAVAGSMAGPQQAKLRAALAQMIDQRTEGLDVRRLPNGMRLVHLNGRFRNVEVAVRGSNGAVHLQCIDSPEELQTPPVPSAAPRPAADEE